MRTPVLVPSAAHGTELTAPAAVRLRPQSLACGARRASSLPDSRWTSSERNIVLGGVATARRGGFEIAHVGRDVALRGSESAPVAAATAVAAAARPVAGSEELDGVGDDLDALSFVAALVLPLAPVEPAFDRNRAAFREVVGAVLALRPPDGDVEVVGLVDPVAALVFAAAVDRDPKLAYGGSTAEMTQLRIPGQVPGDVHHVHIRSCQFPHSLRIRLSGPQSKEVGGATLPPGEGVSANTAAGEALTRRNRRRSRRDPRGLLGRCAHAGPVKPWPQAARSPA